MFISVTILIVSIIIAYIIIPPLMKKGEKKTIVVFTIILTTGAILNIAIGLKMNVPSPLDFISDILMPIRKLLISLLQ